MNTMFVAIASRLSVTTDILSPVKPAVHIFRRINCTTKRSRVIPLPRVRPCGKDVVEGLSRAEFEDEYFCPRYSVVVRQFNGSVRGYIVSANGRHEVMKRLLEKLDFNYVAEVSIGEILVKEDEF